MYRIYMPVLGCSIELFLLLITWNAMKCFKEAGDHHINHQITLTLTF